VFFFPSCSSPILLSSHAACRFTTTPAQLSSILVAVSPVNVTVRSAHFASVFLSVFSLSFAPSRIPFRSTRNHLVFLLHSFFRQASFFASHLRMAFCPGRPRFFGVFFFSWLLFFFFSPPCFVYAFKVRGPKDLHQPTFSCCAS